MDNFNKEYHRETHTIACNYSRSKDNVATNMLDSLVAGSLIVAGGLLLGPLGASLGAAYALTKKVVEIEKEKYSDKNRISSTEEDDYYYQQYRLREENRLREKCRLDKIDKQYENNKQILNINKCYENKIKDVSSNPSIPASNQDLLLEESASTSNISKESEEQTVQSAYEDSVTTNIQKESNDHVTETNIIYNPLHLPELFEQYKPNLLNKAYELLYEQGNNILFQCTKKEFRYWLGGTMGTEYKPEESECRRIRWMKGKYSLQYFIVRLYRVKRDRMGRDMWNKIANIFMINNMLIKSGDLGKNIEKVGSDDKNEIDSMIKKFNEDMERVSTTA